ncbi:myb-like protein X isoform X2 [Solenopsis invicta]|uniref:myb-like protein X isoform X2 n=1 Tax=Solenopsis invicta TaxID=13686 RepID=UPI00193E553E|nr:myb-like protein X isoform X2 [Solenopsis invicta]
MKSRKEKVKKTRLNIEDRVKILEQLENGENSATLAHKYKVSAPTIANIKKDKEKLLKCKNVTFQGKIKKGYTSIGNIFLDQYLYKWFVQKESNGKHVTGSMIQQKALEINRTLNGPKSFKASSGFLWNFTKRHNIKLSCHNKRDIKKDGKEYLEQDSSNDFDQELIEDNAEQERRVSNDGEVIKSEHQINNQLNENNEMEKVKKTRLSIEDRVKILEQFENGENIVTLARKYKVSTPTIANIKKNKEKLLKCKNALVTFQGNNKKGYTGIGNIYLDQYLYKWFVQKKSNGKHVTWSMIQQKALEINRTLNGPKTFKASLGFIWNFTKRHNIKLFSKKKKTKRDGKKYLDPDLSNNFNQNLIEDNAEQKQRLSNNLEVFKSKHQINDEFNENNEIESLKYTRLSIEDRVKILERLENEENSVILAREYKVSGQTIANIKKDKEKLLKCKNALVTFQGNNKKGYSGIRNIFLDQYLYKWFVQKKSNGKHVMGWMIQQKALEINRILNGPESFKASQKFLWNFTKRHNIKLSCCNKRSTKKDGKENLNQDSSNNFVQELIEDNAEQERRVSNDGEVIKSEHQINNELSENNEMERVNVKYTRLNIEDRFKILERLENGENSVTLACEYKVSEATIVNIKKDKEKLLKCKNALVTFQGKIKKGYTGIGNIFLDQYLYKWFVQKKSNRKHVTWSMIQQKALKINRTLNGPKSFKASLGFVWNFIKRHNIKLFHKKRKSKKNGKKYLDQDSSNNFDQRLIEDNAEQEWRISNNREVSEIKHQNKKPNKELNENDEKVKDMEYLKRFIDIENIFFGQSLYEWFVQEKSNGKCVTGPMIQQKTLEMNRMLNNHKSFKAPLEFLHKFTKRHNIKLSCRKKRNTKKDGKEYLDQDFSNNFDQELIEDNAEQEQRISNDGEVIKSEHQINNELNKSNEMVRDNEHLNDSNRTDNITAIEWLISNDGEVIKSEHQINNELNENNEMVRDNEHLNDSNRTYDIAIERRVSNDGEVIKSEHQINNGLNENNETIRDNEHLNDSNRTDDITAVNAFNAISTFLSWYKTHGNGSPEDLQSLWKFWQYSLDQAYNKY